MRKILTTIKRYFKILKAICYLIYCRIKSTNKTRGVAQIVGSFNSGGLEQVAANLYKAFDEEGYNSTVICVTNNVGPICQQLKSPSHLRILYYDFADMLIYCAKNNIRTLLFHFTTFHMISLKLLGFRNYYIIHNTYIWFEKDEWKKLKIKLKFSNGLIAVSEWCKDYFEKKTELNNIKVILNGIDIDNINSGEKSSITRKNLNIKDKEIVCLTVGSYTEQKHQIKLIGIMEEILLIRKDIKIICAGPILNNELYNLFMKKLNSSIAKNNIIPINYIPQEEMGDFIQQNCDIYLQPSIHEAGVPLSVMEALLKGKPVIMTDFMINKTFPNTERIVGMKAEFKNILNISPKDVSIISKKINRKSAKEYALKICEVAENIDKFQTNFEIEDYLFLDRKRMSEEYINYIKI
ncbi:MAG: glycosyltransferase family 4 protein [Bacilli bacterium]|nr:glycosyltransferase family 4 protein [Bacilli bacterium]